MVSQFCIVMQVNEVAMRILGEHNPRLSADNLFLCETCRKSFKKDAVPAISIANNMALAPIPDVISALNPMEVRARDVSHKISCLTIRIRG